MSEETVPCTFGACDGNMFLEQTGYGITNGDKWRCGKCGSYSVMRPYAKPKRADAPAKEQGQ